MDKQKIKETDKQKIAGTYGRFDLVAAKGKGAVCIDESGKEYIDFTSGIGVNALGFCDEGWVKAVTAQLNTLQHCSNLFYTEPQTKAADILTKRSGMENVFFSNSGAEANETAIKTARKYGNGKSENQCSEIITLKGSFHGRTMAALTATGQDEYHTEFYPFVEGFRYCTPGDLDELKSLMNENTCAVMMEMILGEGGVVDLDEDFVKGAAELCAEKDILLIVDEVQTGIGRTGKFFAFEHYGIQPDIVTFAKGIGGGLPIGGALFGKKTKDVLKPGNHGTTYGGNPVACAGALEVLNRLDDEFLQQVEEKGNYFRKRIEAMDDVKSVSGKGLMIGIELKTKSAKDIVSEGLQNGLMLLTAKDKVRLLPPLTITKAETDKGLAVLEKLLNN